MDVVGLFVEVAADLRAQAGEHRPAFSTKRIVDAAFPGAKVTGRSLPQGVDEVVTRTENGVLIIYQRSLSTTQRRFAIAHAVSHLMFDHVHGGARIGQAGHADREQRADAFAAELLVPLSVLATLVRVAPSSDPEDYAYLDHVDEIASRFQVCSAVAGRRIRELHATRNHVALSS